MSCATRETCRLRRGTWIEAIAFLALLGTQATAARAADLSGCWEGCWVSDSTGHKGPLKARFTRIDAELADLGRSQPE